MQRKLQPSDIRRIAAFVGKSYSYVYKILRGEYAHQGDEQTKDLVERIAKLAHNNRPKFEATLAKKKLN